MAYASYEPDSAEEVRQRSPRYPGEDTTPTSQREIWGWYAYGIAAEVFAVCGVGMVYIVLLSRIVLTMRTLGSFLPLTLEQLARERGTLQTSHLPCTGPGSPSAAPGNGTAPAMFRRDGANNEQCIVGILGLEINTASFAMYTFSLAVLVQAVTLVSFSALADYGMASNCFGTQTLTGWPLTISSFLLLQRTIVKRFCSHLDSLDL